jgi:hypothetical protein
MMCTKIEIQRVIEGWDKASVRGVRDNTDEPTFSEIKFKSPFSNQDFKEIKMCTFSRGRLRPGRKCADDGTDGLRFQVVGTV